MLVVYILHQVDKRNIIFKWIDNIETCQDTIANVFFKKEKYSNTFLPQVEILYLTYGVMYGFGASLAYTPSLVILGHYFKRYLGLVNGVVTAGSSVFTMIMPYVIEPLLKRFGLVGTLRSLAVLTSVVMVCALLFKPVPSKLI